MNVISGSFLLMMFSFICNSALSSPPPPGSATAEDLKPYTDWVKGLKNPTTGYGCCDLSDCRVVDYRMTEKGYETFIDDKTFPYGPNKWLLVPEEVILHKENPTGFGIACWSSFLKKYNNDSKNFDVIHNGFYCFTPASGT